MTDLYAGVIGLEVEVEFVDEDGSPHDLRTFTEIFVVLTRPDGTTVQYSRNNDEVVYVTDGADGKVRFFSRENEMDDAGWYEWQGWGVNFFGEYPSKPVRKRLRKSNARPQA